MNKVLLKGLLSVLVLGLLVACNDDEAQGEVLSLTSPDGHEFQYYEVRGEGLTDVTILFAWPTDWTQNAERNQAVPYVGAEVILAGGTTDLRPQDVLELFSDHNAEGVLTAQPDHIYGQLIMADTNRDEIVAVAAEMLATPQFNADWLARTKGALTDQRIETAAFATNQMWAAGRYAVLGDSPLRAALDLGAEGDIAKVDEAQLRQWHAETFTQTGTEIAVVGVVTAEEAGRYVDTIMTDLPVGSPKSVASLAGDYTPRTILLHAPDVEKASIGVIGALPATTDGQDIADVIVMNYLGQSGAGPLFDAIRTEMRASYGIGAGVANFSRANRVFVIGGEVEDAQLLDVRDTILETYETFRTTGDFPGFEDQRQELVDILVEEMQYFDTAAFSILQTRMDGMDPAIIPGIADYAAGFTLPQVQERLKDIYPSRDELIVLAISPNADALPGACVITQIADAAKC